MPYRRRSPIPSVGTLGYCRSSLRDVEGAAVLSVPDVPFIILNLVLLQKGEEFLLEPDSPVVRRLGTDVIERIGHL